MCSNSSLSENVLNNSYHENSKNSELPLNLKEIECLLRNNDDSDRLIPYLVYLKELTGGKNPIQKENDIVLPIINSCINTASSEINKSFLAFKTIAVYREFLILFLILKLHFVKEDLIEYNNTVLLTIENKMTFINFCNKQKLYLQAEYYYNKCKSFLKVMNEHDYNKKDIMKNKLAVKELILDLYHIETLINSAKLEESLNEILNAKSLLLNFPYYQKYFFHLCYNASVKFIKQQQYEKTIRLLEDIHSIIEDSENSREISKLLAYVFSIHKPEENAEKCLYFLKLSYEIKSHSNFILKMLKAAILTKKEKNITDTLDWTFQASDCLLSLILKVIVDLKNNGYSHLIYDFIKNSQELKFPLKENFYLSSLELECLFEMNSLNKASDVIERVIKLANSHNTNSSMIHSLCKVISTFASKKFKEQCYNKSLHWYEKCSKLLDTQKVKDKVFFFIQQQIVLCYIELNEGETAKKIVNKLSFADPFNVYLALQVSILCGDESEIQNILRCIEIGDPQIQKALLSSCKRAFLLGKKDYLLKILHTLQLVDSAESIVSQARLSQCLIRLLLKEAENKDILKEIIAHLEKTLELIKNNKEHDSPIDWFACVTWNLALDPELEPGTVFRLAILCCCFFELTRGTSVQMKNALLLVASSGLECIQSKEDAAHEDIIRKVLTAIEQCHILEAASNNFDLLSLLYVYEFEARIYKNDGSEKLILSKMLATSWVDAEALRNTAAIAYGHNPRNYNVVTEALKGAISKKLEEPALDCEAISNLYHSLIQVLFHAQEYLELVAEDETWNVCEKLSNLLDTLPNYPQIEIFWLMSKCWNWGIQKLASNDESSGRDWCTLALGFHEKLTDLRSLHEKKLQALYDVYFTRPSKELHDKANYSMAFSPMGTKDNLEI